MTRRSDIEKGMNINPDFYFHDSETSKRTNSYGVYDHDLIIMWKNILV